MRGGVGLGRLDLRDEGGRETVRRTSVCLLTPDSSLGPRPRTGTGPDRSDRKIGRVIRPVTDPPEIDPPPYDSPDTRDLRGLTSFTPTVLFPQGF